MKTLFTLILATAFTLGAMAQNAPTAAQDHFKKQYPNAEKVSWDKKDKDGKTWHMAEYTMNGKEHKAVYDANGKLVKHKTELQHSELPQAIQTAMKSQHKDHKVDDAYLVQKDGKTFYIVKFEGKDDKKVAYSADGTLLKDHKDWD